MDKRQTSVPRTALFGFTVAALTVLLWVVVIEFSLPFIVSFDRYLPYYPNSVRYLYPSEEITPGVSGVSRFSTNSYGARGREPNGRERLRILTLGGSTTACTVLDDTKTWPAVLERLLDRRLGAKNEVWVANIGMDGLVSDHLLMHVKYYLPQLPHIDYVIVQAGSNDMGLWFHHEHFDPDYLRKNWNSRVGEAFRWSAYTPQDQPIYKRLALWKLASRLKDMYQSSQNEDDARRVIVQDEQLKWIEEMRKYRRQRESKFLAQGKLDTLPLALDSYERVLRLIAEETRKNGAKPIFMTQAVQSRFSSEEEKARIWIGAMNDGEGFVSEEQYPAILDQYNQRMKKVAEDEGGLLVDMASELEPGARPFYDGLHFNDWGAAEAGRILAKFFVERGLLHNMQTKNSSKSHVSPIR
jgi:lysophospholipase L1-like esterase